MHPASRTERRLHGLRLVVGLALLLFPSVLWPQKSKSTPSCTSITFIFTLKAGETFEQRLNELTFQLRPLEKDWGWRFSLENGARRDFVYPVNPPLRFNPAQILGRGYSYSTRESLKNDRELRFLLSQADYERFEPIVLNALWPYNASKPECATDEYFAALAKVRTGVLRMKILEFEVTPDDVVRSAKFQAEFIVPSDFQFDPSLKPRALACPPKPRPLNFASGCK